MTIEVNAPYIEQNALFEQRKGRFVGRRGRVLWSNDLWVVLSPAPGSCPCPRKQRRTELMRGTFDKQWEPVAE